MKLKWCNAALLLLALLAMGSCLSPRKQMIFKGMEYDTRYKAVPPEELRITRSAGKEPSISPNWENVWWRA